MSFLFYGDVVPLITDPCHRLFFIKEYLGSVEEMTEAGITESIYTPKMLRQLTINVIELFLLQRYSYIVYLCYKWSKHFGNDKEKIKC